MGAVWHWHYLMLFVFYRNNRWHERFTTKNTHTTHNSRRFTIMQNIHTIQSDIVCLEVWSYLPSVATTSLYIDCSFLSFHVKELDHYWTFFKYEMEKEGYDSVYIKRPSLHHTSWSGKDKSDGCGIFWHRNRFAIVEVLFCYISFSRICVFVITIVKSTIPGEFAQLRRRHR